jgi:hypothetical protein
MMSHDNYISSSRGAEGGGGVQCIYLLLSNILLDLELLRNKSINFIPTESQLRKCSARTPMDYGGLDL